MNRAQKEAAQRLVDLQANFRSKEKAAFEEGRFHFELRWPPKLVRVMAADRRWGFVLNTYPTGKRWCQPGAVIGMAFYLGRHGISFLWGRPHWRPE